MNTKRIASLALALSLLVPEAFLAQQKAGPSSALNPPAASGSRTAAQSSSSSPAPGSERPRPPRHDRRSYNRETTSRHHSGISKQEKVMLVAIAGTSMGIGALAGGPTGLAIGAIVGGWSAYAGHRLWRWIK